MKKTEQGNLFSTEHIATNNHVKKLGLMYVPHNLLIIEEGFNDRTDYGTAEEMNELAESIYQVGPKVPLKGYKKGENYVVLQGHRRHRAGEIIEKKYGKRIVFPFQCYSPGTTMKEMLLDTLLTNSGKDLTPLEKASVVDKLFIEGMQQKEISSALGGVSGVYVKNLQKLWGIPEEAKKLIRDGVVSATFVMGALKSKDTNFEEWLQEIIKQANSEDQQPRKGKGGKKKQSKITKKKAEKKKLSSMKEFGQFRKWLKAKETEEDKLGPISKNKREVFEFMVAVADNEASYQAIFKFFTGK